MIDVTSSVSTTTELEQEVDKELAEFDKWVQTELKSQPLVRSEKAILKTFLWYKIKAKNAVADQPNTVETSNGA